MNHQHILAALFAASVLPSQAASDLTNPLNTYVGNTQANLPAQPAFLSTSGLNVAFVWGGGANAWERIDFLDAATAVLPRVPGATFGAFTGGSPEAGRNYLRTVETDYHTKSFTAFVTVKRPLVDANNRRTVFFGLGTGALNGGGANPDAGTTNAAAYFELQNGFGNVSRRAQSNTQANVQLNFHGMTQVSSESLRMRMEFNSTARTLTLSHDYDHVPGNPFTADQTFPATSTLTQGSEWFGGDRASIFFGGDRSIVFTDLVITTTQAPAPTPKGLLLASVGSATATISWPADVSGATYSVYRSETSGVYTTPLATGLTSATYTDTTVVNGTPYFYVITQTNPGSLESAFSNETTATPVAGALPPQGIVALNSGNQAVLVDWADLVSAFDTYRLYRSTNGGTSFSLLATGLTASRYLDQAVTNGSTFIYKVTSVLGGNESVDSATAQAIPNPLEVFVDFDQNSASSGRGVLATGAGNTWNNVGGGSSVATSKLNDSAGSVSALGIDGGSSFGPFSFTGTNVGGDPATLTDTPGLMVDYRFSDSSNVRNYTFSGLPPNRTYDLYLFGYGGGVDQNSGFRIDGIAKQTTDATGLTTLTETRHYVTFTVESDVNGAFTIDWSGPGNLGLTDVHAGSGAGFNGFQLVENATAVLQPLSPDAFGTLAAVEVSWESVFGTTSYQVYRSTTRATGYSFLANAGNNTLYNDTSAVPGTPYFYVVKALNGTVESFFSAEASGTRELPLIVDADLDGLSDSDEALIGTNPNSAADFFVAPTSGVTRNGGNFDVAFTIRGAPGTYVIERSTTLAEGSWTEIPASSQSFTWNTGTVLDHTLNLSAPGLTPALGGKEFFRAKGVAAGAPQ